MSAKIEKFKDLILDNEKEILSHLDEERKELHKSHKEKMENIKQAEEALKSIIIFEDDLTIDAGQVNFALKLLEKSEDELNEFISRYLQDLTGSRKLSKNQARCLKKVEVMKKLKEHFQTYTKEQLQNELTLVASLKLLGEKTPEELQNIFRELSYLETKWNQWKDLKELCKEKDRKKTILSALQGKTEEEVTKLKEYLKRFERASSREKIQIKQELKNSKLVEISKSKQLDKLLSVLKKDLQEHSLSDIQARFEYLKEFSTITGRELESCFREFLLLSQLRDINTRVMLEKSGMQQNKKSISLKIKEIDKNASLEERRRFEQFSRIDEGFKRLRNSSNISNIRKTFKVLEGKSFDEMAKEFKRIKEIEHFYVNKAIIKEIIKKSNNSSISQAIQEELEIRKNNEAEETQNLNCAREIENNLRKKSYQEIDNEIKELENLKVFISGEKSELKLNSSSLNKWKEIQKKAIKKVEDESKKISNLRFSGRNSAGIKSIDFDEETDQIISVSSSYEGDIVFTIDIKGYGKCTNLDEFRLTRRNASGSLACLNKEIYDERQKRKAAKLKNKSFNEKNVTEKSELKIRKSHRPKYFEDLVACTLINKKEDVITLLTEKGFFKRFKATKEIMPVKDERLIVGKKLIDLEKNDKIKCFTRFKIENPKEV